MCMAWGMRRLSAKGMVGADGTMNRNVCRTHQTRSSCSLLPSFASGRQVTVVKLLGAPRAVRDGVYICLGEGAQTRHRRVR